MGPAYFRQGQAEYLGGEARVFEPEQQTQVQRDGSGQQRLRPAAARQQQRRAPVQQHGKKQQRQRPQPRAGIEKQAEREQDKIPAAAKAPGQYEIQRDNGG